ncbi:MAG: serine/threonine protein kinase [Anaerolineae bacterium]|nr:serine/threonine protein kinase [Anaerolineae bacterium]MDW8069931.1 serine/threonine-protein kinase [Anaerolineae bacterium]
METSLWFAIPDYEVEAEIGCGNLTRVYRARRKADGRLVSIKVVLPEFAADRTLVRRFIEAASRAIKLDHPNIARTFEVAEREGVVYVVREYLEASCLAEWLAQQGPVPLEQVVPIVRQLASALDYAHSRRVMHGDINDRCIYIDAEGRVKLADFGLVQSVPGSELERGRIYGIRMVQGLGACEYLAPERVQGQGPNRSADIYALGIVTYQLLTGAPPFQGEPEEVLSAQVYETPQPVHLVDPQISSTVSATISRVLAKRPELRYSTATEFARAFAAAAEGIAPKRSPQVAGSIRPPSKTTVKSPGLPAAAGLTALVVLAIALLWHLGGIGAWVEKQTALWLSALVPSTPVLSSVNESPLATPTRGATFTPRPIATATTTPTPLLVTPATPFAPESVVTPIATTTPVTVSATAVSFTPTAQASPVASPAASASFSNLIVAAGIDQNNRPVSPGTTFSAMRRPLYVFFEYRNMSPQVTWGYVWLRENQILNRAEENWPARWGSAGRAWIYYTPEVSYLPGAYQVQLLINGQVVATTTFTIR